MHKIAVFASGSGTNCENLIRYFQDSEKIEVAVVITNNPFAGVIERASNLDTDCFINLLKTTDDFQTLDDILDEYNIDWIVLAGFLKLVPRNLIIRYRQRMINIHPALLPAYGGKGMYGMKVHEAVIAAGEKQSGITIHYVNEHYDEGAIIEQFICPVLKNDTPEELARRIHELEHKHFPEVVEKVILKTQTS
jgi:phosphoribosylglycinamide formyltransferase 1